MPAAKKKGPSWLKGKGLGVEVHVKEVLNFLAEEKTLGVVRVLHFDPVNPQTTKEEGSRFEISFAYYEILWGGKKPSG